MDWRRFWRHVVMTPAQARRAFPQPVRDAIEHFVAEHERRHRGEIRFVIEAELTTAQLWAGLSARARAIDLFARLGVWDTAERTGVLVYVLLADHAVEVVADRGISAQVDAAQWNTNCAAMVACYREGGFESGSIAGIEAIAERLERLFPADGSNPDELSNRPVLI